MRVAFPVPVSAIGNPGAPLGSLFYSYNGGYKTADTLYPGRGYWVKADGEGKLILSMDSLSFKTKISEKTK